MLEVDWVREFIVEFARGSGHRHPCDVCQFTVDVYTEGYSPTLQPVPPTCGIKRRDLESTFGKALDIVNSLQHEHFESVDIRPSYRKGAGIGIELKDHIPLNIEDGQSK
jgi:hypothetical protein